MPKGIHIDSILLVALSITFGLTSVSGDDQRHYSQYGFSIVPPEGWIVLETPITHEYFGLVKFSHPTDINVGFGIISRTTMLPLEQVVARMRESNRQEKDYQLLFEGDIAVNDIPGYEFVYTYRSQNDTVKDKDVLLSYYCGQVYEIRFISTGDTYNGTQDRYNQRLPTFEASLATFEIYDPEGEVEPNTTAIVGGETYESREEGFSITGPSGWTMGEGIFIGPEVDGKLPVMMNVGTRDRDSATYEEGMSLDEFLEAELPTYEFMGCKIISQKDLTIGEFDARGIVYTTLSGGKDKTIFLVGKKTAYVVTFEADPELYDEYVDEFDASAATFRVIGTRMWMPIWLLGGLITVVWRGRHSEHVT